ncbi:MAG: GatB/YqeY domain-containing protein [bacterium]|nr:GatB/YqeY domain-containing protein [bacterium]
MPIHERLDHDFKEAMKAKDEIVLSVLRLVRTALKNRQIELQHPLSDAEVQAVLKTMIKQYQDAIVDFTSANRQDLVERQQKEIDIIAAYLPPALPQEELEKIVEDALVASGITEMGKAMGVAMKAVDGRADGNAVRVIVQRLLSR